MPRLEKRKPMFLFALSDERRRPPTIVADCNVDSDPDRQMVGDLQGQGFNDIPQIASVVYFPITLGGDLDSTTVPNP